MIDVLTILIIVFGFCFALREISTRFLSHLIHLENLLKAKDLFEAKHFETKYEETKIIDEPESLIEVFNDKSPQDIRSEF